MSTLSTSRKRKEQSGQNMNKAIADSMDVTPYYSPVIILSDGRVVYHQEIPGKPPREDPVWMVGDKEEWQNDFDNLSHDDVAKLESFCGAWDGVANASNIFSYIQYFGHCRAMHEPDWKWGDYSGSVLNVYDEYTAWDGDEDDDEDEADDCEVCENCAEAIPRAEEYELPETSHYYKATVCKKCFNSPELDEYFKELENERGYHHE